MKTPGDPRFDQPDLLPADPEASLEPEWAAFRELGQRMVDESIEWLASLRERPPWRPLPDDVRARLETPCPRAGLGDEATYAEFKRDVRAYPYGNVHPRFWGWVNGSGVPVAAYADMLASFLNNNCGAFDQAAVSVELQVLEWMKELLDLPPASGGILTSGASMANLLALGAARDARSPVDVRKLGVGALPRPLAVYGSAETHFSIQKALEILGLGSDSFRAVPADDELCIDVAALERMIAADRAAGLQPAAVVASAGTINTGAIDDLEALADLCEREQLWFHVDGAIATVAWLVPEMRPLLKGMQRADSLAFDLHKWLFLPSDVGCVFVRDPADLEQSYAYVPDYLTASRGGLSARLDGNFKDRGLELTRRFRALKVWFALKSHGADEFAQVIRRNLLQARHLGRLLDAAPGFEVLAPVRTCVTAFRYRGDVAEEHLDDLNRELLVRLQVRGVAVPSQTKVRGHFALRTAITNHRTRTDDLDYFVKQSAHLARELVEELHANGSACAWVRAADPAPIPST